MGMLPILKQQTNIAVSELKVKHSRLVAELEAKLTRAIESVYVQQMKQSNVIEDTVGKSQIILSYI